MSAGVRPAIWVVKAPIHVDNELEVSRAIPLAESVIPVPPPVFCRMKGEPVNTEHEDPIGRPTHTVLNTPGPKLVRSKWTSGLLGNAMKSRTTDGPPKVRSLTVPWTDGSSVPVEYVTFVPVAVARHPVPPPTGRVKSISVPDAVAPPPP